MPKSTVQSHNIHRNHIDKQEVKSRKLHPWNKFNAYVYPYPQESIDQPIENTQGSCRMDLIMVFSGIQLFTCLFFKVIKNIYLQFISFSHTDMTQVVEILAQVR